MGDCSVFDVEGRYGDGGADLRRRVEQFISKIEILGEECAFLKASIQPISLFLKYYLLVLDGACDSGCEVAAVQVGCVESRWIDIFANSGFFFKDSSGKISVLDNNSDVILNLIR